MTSSAVLLFTLAVVLLGSASSSPMFGLGGMMHRTFPGSSDMSYRTYIGIHNSNSQRRRDTAIANRIGATTDDEDSDASWMSKTNYSPVANRLDTNPDAVYTGGYRMQQYNRPAYQFRYPTRFNPRESFAAITMPDETPSRRSGGGYGYY